MKVTQEDIQGWWRTVRHNRLLFYPSPRVLSVAQKVRQLLQMSRE